MAMLIELSVDHSIVLSLPFMIVWHVKIPPRKKFVLLTVFSLTVVVMVVAIVRVAVVNSPTKNPSISWLYLWSSIEMTTCMCWTFPVKSESLTIVPHYKLLSLPVLHRFANFLSQAAAEINLAERDEILRLAVYTLSLRLWAYLSEAHLSNPREQIQATTPDGIFRLGEGWSVTATPASELPSCLSIAFM